MRLQSLCKRATLAIAGVALALGLSACSAQPGVALQIDDTTYTEDEVSEAARQLTEISGQQFPASGVVYMLAQEPALREVATSIGLDFTEDDARNALASAEELTGQAATEATVVTVRANQLYNLLASTGDLEGVSAQVIQAMANHDIQLNPRYGQVTEDNLLEAPHLNGVVDQATLMNQ